MSDSSRIGAPRAVPGSEQTNLSNSTPLHSDDNSRAPKGAGRRRLKSLLRLGIAILVAWGLWHSIDQAQAKFAQQQLSWRDVDLAWLFVAAVLYVSGLTPCWLFWHRTLLAMKQRPRARDSLRAYFIGHLGKYVPGKALVVVLRTERISGPRVDTAIAAISVFVETLTMMAIGAALASLLIATILPESQLLWLAVGLSFGAGLPTIPPVTRKIVSLLQVRRLNPETMLAVQGLDIKLMALGWAVIGLGWVLMGLSLWATMLALPNSATPSLPSLYDLSLVTASVCLAMVAGFLSLLPGGLGVRELVVITLLSPSYGEVAAITSAGLLRIVWLLSELFVSAILTVGFLSSHPRSRTG
jgi:uncharacterized membrane protein YbhN (UPF0104 family)